ncbi:MAG: hypothetical protein CVV39_04765 [Planctomycetes bacterium HGW-Planctomycetes-1]|nr:MAG: hypothetical protein CVV39_04765 [Planctomycetes bacterium HGW-Planctomycetes-1]
MTAEYLKEICKSKFGKNAEPNNIIKPSTGKFNESYFFSLDGKDYVFRMAPPDDAGFLFYEKNMMAQEPGLHKIIREKTTIPVAEIFVYDDSKTIAPRPYIIMGKLSGEPLPYSYNFSIYKVLKQTGQYLKQLHSITLLTILLLSLRDVMH